MASLFKKRLRCFYCGRRSTQSQNGPVRQFKCLECQAVNYLDENGEITDPPVSAASRAPSAQYARPLPRPDSQEPAPDSSIFCSTCVKNQYLFTQTLASYLPPQSHPEYEAYEASYPAYKRSLEERYPQVCAQCEPRVRNRIREAGYAAKSDHLRRMMERSRRRHAHRHACGWRSLLVSVGAVTFWTSIAGQLAWNIMGSLAEDNNAMLEESEALSLPLLTSCVNTALRKQKLSSQCSTALAPYAGLSLCLGALSIWWNPRLRHKVDGKGGRLKGLGEYYKIQIVVLVVRFMAWAGLQDPSITGLNPRLSPAAHIFMAIFTIISVIVSRSVVKFDTTPLVSWNDNIGPLIPQAPKSQAQSNQQLPSPPNSQSSHPTSNLGSQRFPISNLAPIQSREPEPYNPPTPPLDPVDEVDMMDWTPSQQTSQLNITPKHVPPPQAQGPSPFQGQLPAAPKPLSWQLRNPASRAPQQPVEDKPNPFRQSQKPTSENGNQPAPSETLFAPPKFFPPSDFAADTGLESLFDKTFSLSDDPSDVKKMPWSASTALGGRGVHASGRSSSYLKSTLLAGCLVLWSGARIFSLPGNIVEALVLGITFLVAGFSLLESLMRPMAIWSVTDVLLSLLELISCGCLATYFGHETYDLYRFDKIAKCLVAFMAGQQMITLRVFSPGERSEPQPHVSSTVSPSTADAAGRQQLGGKAVEPSNPAKEPVVNGNKTNRNDTIRSHSHASNDFAVRENRKITANRDSSTVHPAPFSAIPRPQQPQPLSFSSFGSALPENLMSPGSAASVSSASYASSVISDPPSPQKQSFLRRNSRATPGPSIGALSLDDGPVTRTTRYPLRGRRA